MARNHDLIALFPKQDKNALDGFVKAFEATLSKWENLQAEDRKTLKGRESDEVAKHTKTIKKFASFLKEDFFPFQHKHIFHVLNHNWNKKHEPILLGILEEYLSRLEEDRQLYKGSTVSHRPANEIRRGFCEDIIENLYSHLKIFPTLSRDETSFNKYIAYGIARLEKKEISIDQVYRIIRPIHKKFLENGIYELEDMRGKDWETFFTIDQRGVRSRKKGK